MSTSTPVELDNFNALLASPGKEAADALFGSVREHRDWGITDLQAYTWFMSEVEWSWRSDDTPLEDL